MDDKDFHNLLFSAIQHHNVSLLDDLLDGDEGRSFVNLPGEDGNMPLHTAVIENDLRCVQCLLQHGADPNVFDTTRSRTPLQLAIELGQTDIVKAFLELEYINLDIRDDRSLTCHEIALFCDNQVLADLIKTRHEEIDQLKDDFYSVINQACSNNEPNLVRELILGYEMRIKDKFSKWALSQRDGHSFARLRIRELVNWSSSSWNDVTLLFKSASKGHTAICKLLIEFGATAKCNENTNYSPLYVAAYGGFTDTVKLLLDSFPSLICEVTIEKWTTLHACCLKGHSETAKLILTYPYPEDLKRRFVSRSGLYEYYFAFDLNAQDAAGQTVVYLSVFANDVQLLNTLLQFNVQAKLLEIPDQQKDSKQVYPTGDSRVKSIGGTSLKNVRIIPDRPKLPNCDTESNSRGLNNQLDKVMRQLRKINVKEVESDKSDSSQSVKDRKYLICPFEMDTYCDYNSKTALHLAVCQRYHSIVNTLLINGSNPNLPILSRDSIKSDFINSNIDSGLNWLRSSKSTCLKEACRLNDEEMCEILIQHGARDNQDNLALQVAASNKNNCLISKFLALKSNVDPEYKINKKCNVEFASRYKQSQKLSKPSRTDSTTTFSSMFPSVPVMIDWQSLKCVRHIDLQWLIDASLIHNKRLKHQATSLLAITRLDLSSNNFKSIHPVIFRLPSLRELNLSKNRLESLFDFGHGGISPGSEIVPTSKLIESHRTALKRSKSSQLSSVNLESSNMIDLNEPQEWDLPYLEILDLHDNRLISLPDCLFKLPRLSELDVSSNQIRQLPWSMWMAPALREVIASGNLLNDLPKLQQTGKINSNIGARVGHNDSPTEERSSLASNHSVSFENSFMSSVESIANKNRSYIHLFDASELTDNPIESLKLPVNHLNYWAKKIDIDVAKVSEPESSEKEETQSGCKIIHLNLSHNSFANIPQVLACLAPELTRLNLSYNRIVALGQPSLYPAKIKSIDLSGNLIDTWFESNRLDGDIKQCYSELNGSNSRSTHGYSCIHTIHQRLDGLKSLNLSRNLLRDIRLALPSEQTRNSTDDFDSRLNPLIYPNITSLDLSFNRVHLVPKTISKLKDLSVLNLSGNISISHLPPELGLASKLWNLGINGCSLSEPLKSIVESKSYKTMDIIGYLRSILEEAKPYARMKLMLVGLQGIGKTSLLEQMRLEGSSGSRRRLPEHWTKRMGHTTKSNIRNQRGITLSTVGVDIHDWVFCKRTPRNQPNFGPVSFSTWDFGGQQEFYATHRYFLSKRSIYLVIWRLTDGLNGILGLQQWLVNIHSRASSSPVIIVGTHEDLIEGGEKGEIVSKLQEDIYKRFINISDHDKCGLPRVMDSVVVSTKTKLNIKNLCNRIYDIVFSLKCPGSTERLLEQKIPATYLYLEEIVNWIVHDRQQKRKEPVLSYEEYRRITSEQLKANYNKVFRDLEPLNSREINYNSELQQATRFLHENGVLLHYEDTNLRDLYFLDPQWLCDILSHVVTVREINPHIKNGLMKIDDLDFLFKSIDVNLSGGLQSYVVNLLNKFEIALTWNSQYLLIPSLLPSDLGAINEEQDFHVLAPRMRGRSAVRRYEPNRSTMRSSSIEPKRGLNLAAKKSRQSFEIDYRPEKTTYRLILLRYLPAGFLARLQSGVLSDPIYDDVCNDLHTNIAQKSCDEKLNEFIGSRAGWTCWKYGINLTLQHESTINSKSSNSSNPIPLLSIQETSTLSKDSIYSSKKFRVECSQTNSSSLDSKNKWSFLDITQYVNIIQISVASWRLKIIDENGSELYIEPEYQSIAKLLANTMDHIDNLLEDWYPSLGARFAHTLGGNYLVSRVIPCISCFSLFSKDQRHSRADTRRSRAAVSKIKFSLSSALEASEATNSTMSDLSGDEIYCYYVEQCILNAYNYLSSSDDDFSLRSYAQNIVSKKLSMKNLHCPRHGVVALSAMAPDIVFDDIPDWYKIESDKIDRCKLIGRGTFGFVFKGSLHRMSNSDQLISFDQEVALKLLQPVDPGPDAEQAEIAAYKSTKSNWLREPYHCVCKSYYTARHEVNILQSLSHPNIVLFIGLCVRPLAIVLELAPLGCLTDIFKNYKRAGMRIDQYSVQKTCLQIARALEFLHQQRIIYRDLKAENVLVWSFPSPFATQLQATVEIKLADYGISRQALSTGIWKGFAGTINFLAPEILRHNGDEEYTEKVDCFSFGIFMYELLTLRPPYKNTEGTKNHLNDGGRLSITMRDLIYPNHMIDLMSVCWSQEPHHRPTASQIVSIASTPEFMQLLDVVSLESQSQLKCCAAIQYTDNLDCKLDLWLGRNSFGVEVLSTSQDHWAEYQRLAPNNDLIKPTVMCVVENKIWFCDSMMMIHMLPLEYWFRNHNEDIKLAMASNSSNQDEELSRLQSFSLNMPESFQSSIVVQQMIYVKPGHCVIMLLSNGQIWIYQLNNLLCRQLDDGSIQFKCLAVQEMPSKDDSSSDSDPFHIYCGQLNGISCLEIVKYSIHRQSILPLAGNSLDLSGERIIDSSQSTEVTSILCSKNLIWTAAGCTVHLWSVQDKCVARKLDCWKLVPCSESLESINIENYYQQAQSSVVSNMVYLNNQLFVGTSHGCFIVIEADSLKPIIVFRPYESNITILSPIIDEDARYVVTIGTGYRDLMKRYLSFLDNSEHFNDVAILWSANGWIF